MDKMDHPLFSVIIPIYNEAGNIVLLDQEIKTAMARLDASDAEIIYVDDGSSDGSDEELKALKGVTVITLNRNYGQATALDAGFKAAKGEYIISLDGDGQNDPKDIELLYRKLVEEDLDVVAGWRKNRKDSKGINTLTLIGRFMRRRIIKDIVHDTGCTLRIYTHEAAKSLDIGGEMHRYILAILSWKGFRIGEVVVSHRPRVNGKSKYNYSKAIKGFIDLIGIWFIQKYSQRPLHLFGYMALMLGFFGGATFLLSLYQKLFTGLPFNRNAWFFGSGFLLLAAIIFFSFGIVIDLLIRIHLNASPNEKRYYIRNISK
jgi:glycosyltransferase involved in cell wall biosynthesis